MVSLRTKHSSTVYVQVQFLEFVLRASLYRKKSLFNNIQGLFNFKQTLYTFKQTLYKTKRFPRFRGNLFVLNRPPKILNRPPTIFKQTPPFPMVICGFGPWGPRVGPAGQVM